MKRSMIWVLAVVVLLSISSSHAGVPPLMNYQGKLTDEYGVPVSDGNYTIWFRIYTDSVAGDALWEEEQWSVPVDGGLFSVLLGSTEDIPDTVFTGPTRYLGIQVSPAPEFTPRKPIVSMAYAFRSAKTDTADYALKAPRDDDWLPDTSGLHIYRSTGNVGIGMVSLESKLGVAGTAEMTGFKMPEGAVDGHVLTSDGDGVGNWQPASTGSSKWTVTDSVLYTNNYWGIARGGAGNLLYGGNAHTHVNLGMASTTGAPGQSYNGCVVGGGYNNEASHYESTVGGGVRNIASGNQATVGGGDGNTASAMHATVGGGRDNTASDIEATVGGGTGNTASNYWATVAGGGGNEASGGSSFVGGGDGNIAIGGGATVSGGVHNTASGWNSNIVGGQWCEASGSHSTVVGGRFNSVAGDYSFAGGSEVTVDSIADHTLAFGRDFTTSTPNAVIFHNSVDPVRMGVGTPDPDTTLHIVGNIKMVDGNQAAGKVLTSDANGVGSWQETSGGGSYWTVTDSVLYTSNYWGIVRGGAGNIVYGDSGHTCVNLGVASVLGYAYEGWPLYCTISGGHSNAAWFTYSTVGGGRNNFAKLDYSTVGGGQSNQAYEAHDVISGGFNNVTSGNGACTIGGGKDNEAWGYGATVGGGTNNHADPGTVGGGRNNRTNGYSSSTVGGGIGNTASWGATVGGGSQNLAEGAYATVAGGYADSVSGDYSFATGRLVRITEEADYTLAFGRDFTISTPNAVIFHNSVDAIKVGAGTPSPTATLDVNGSTGYSQLRVRTSFTPSASSDTLGNVGDIAWDDDYMYVKTSTGWKRTALSTF